MHFNPHYLCDQDNVCSNGMAQSHRNMEAFQKVIPVKAIDF